MPLPIRFATVSKFRWKAYSSSLHLINHSLISGRQQNLDLGDMSDFGHLALQASKSQVGFSVIDAFYFWSARP
jgi:hypothetical protein